MIASERLLTMHPLDALRAQMEEVIKPPLKAAYLKVSSPKSLGGTLTSVEVSVDRSKTPLDLWEIAGRTTFTYNRLNLDAFTKGINKKVKVSLGVHSQSVLQAMLDPYHIPVAGNDVVDALHTAYGDTTLTADEKSWRWVGETGCVLEVMGIEITHLLKVDHFTIPFDAQFFSDKIKDRLMTYVNMANASSLPTPIEKAMITFNAPEVNAPNSYGDNTRLQLFFNGMPYVGSVFVYYMRRDFDITFRHPVKISGGQLTNTQALAGALSSQMGCTITAADIKSEAFPQMVKGSTTPMAVNIDVSSLAYVGSILVHYSRTT